MTPKNNEGQVPMNQTASTSRQLKKFQEETVTHVLTQVESLDQNGGLHLPKDYSAGNALKSAWLKLLETEDSKNVPVLESCSKESICNALLDMVVQGLNPMKKQCAFIGYAGKLSMQPEYHGNIALARRYGGVKHVRANVIYEGDDFKYSIEPTTGLRTIVHHEQDFDNIDTNKIRGAYATLIQEDGTVYIEVMNIIQIRKAWEMGFGKGATKAHKNFSDQMALKTVINRACKLFISTSNDAGLVEGREYKDRGDPVQEDKEETLKSKANKKNLNIQEAKVVDETPEPEVEKKDIDPIADQRMDASDKAEEDRVYDEAMAEANSEGVKQSESTGPGF